MTLITIVIMIMTVMMVVMVVMMAMIVVEMVMTMMNEPVSIDRKNDHKSQQHLLKTRSRIS